MMNEEDPPPPWWFKPSVLGGIAAATLAMAGLAGLIAA